jgi:hypothetical protein
MTDAMPDGYVVHMPPPKIGAPPVRHVFGPDIRIARDLSPSGFEQIERTCANCGAVKITIIGIGEPRAWRRTAEGPQITTSIEPPCDLDTRWP